MGLRPIMWGILSTIYQGILGREAQYVMLNEGASPLHKSNNNAAQQHYVASYNGP